MNEKYFSIFSLILQTLPQPDGTGVFLRKNKEQQKLLTLAFCFLYKQACLFSGRKKRMLFMYILYMQADFSAHNQ
jgi:hypothetical protein